jgi:hypothetical protein
MLSKEIESRHLDRFRQALYYLERFDTEGKKWEIDKHNIVRREGPSGSINKETNWGKLSHIDDWFIERVVLKKSAWNPHCQISRVRTRGDTRPLQNFTLSAIVEAIGIGLELVVRI